MDLEDEGGEHRAEFVDGRQIVAIDEHVATPFADTDDEEFDLEIRGRLPLAEDFEDSLLGIFVPTFEEAVLSLEGVGVARTTVCQRGKLIERRNIVRAEWAKLSI
jgi:hypothetical protein